MINELGFEDGYEGYLTGYFRRWNWELRVDIFISGSSQAEHLLLSHSKVSKLYKISRSLLSF